MDKRLDIDQMETSGLAKTRQLVKQQNDTAHNANEFGDKEEHYPEVADDRNEPVPP